MKLNVRGSSGSKPVPQSGQAKWTLISRSSQPVAVCAERTTVPCGQLQRQVDALGEAGADALADDQPIDHGVDVVELGLGKLRLAGAGDLDDLAVDPGAEHACPADRLKGLEVLPLAAAHQGGQDQDLPPSWNASTSATICSGVWRRIARPQRGQ